MPRIPARNGVSMDEAESVTFDDIRNIALGWPEVEDGTSYGTLALKVRKKLLVRLKEDGDSLVISGVRRRSASC
jgi:hypothetical protein